MLKGLGELSYYLHLVGEIWVVLSPQIWPDAYARPRRVSSEAGEISTDDRTVGLSVRKKIPKRRRLTLHGTALFMLRSTVSAIDFS